MSGSNDDGNSKCDTARMAVDERTLYLVGMDNATRFVVSVRVAKKSKMLRNMIADVGLDELAADEISLRTSYVDLVRTIEYMTAHVDDTDDPVVGGWTPSDRRAYVPCAADAAFLARHASGNDSASAAVVIELMHAANYLDVPGLVNLAAHAIAGMISNRTPAQLRALFGLPHDMTAKEMAALEDQYPWLREPASVTPPVPQS